MHRFRFLLIVLLAVAALSQMGRLYAQDNPDEPDTVEAKVFLPAIIGGAAAEQAGEENADVANILVHLTYRSHEELEFFLAELDVPRVETSRWPRTV